MIKINCKTEDTIKLTDMLAFQGNLKKRTDQDVKELIGSLTTEGLMMPFAVWNHDSKNYLLDGHGRKEALVKLAVDDPELLTVDWPCVYIDAETEDDARRALLQITSSYGKVTKAGYKQFCATIPEYHAPVINKFISKPVKVKEQKQVKAPEKTIIKIRVDTDKLDQVKEILSQVTYIEVL